MKSYALTIGVGQRKDENENYNVTAKDAERLACELEKRYEFDHVECIKGDDTKFSKLESKLDGFINLVNQAHNEEEVDLVIIFFSGHGYSNAKGDFFLICKDTDNEDIEKKSYGGDDFIQKINKIESKAILLLLNTCFAANILSQNAPKGFKYAPIPLPLEKFTKNNRVAICAAAKDQESYIGDPYSPFTYALLEGLQGDFFSSGDNDVKLFDLAMYLRERVVALTRRKQHPRLDLLEEGLTTNFTIISEFSNNQPDICVDEDESFKLFELILSSDGGGIEEKRPIDIDSGIEWDKKYRKIITEKMNFTEITGDNNIVIQDITGSHITLNINGVSREIEKNLDAVKEVLDEVNARTVLISKSIIRIFDFLKENIFDSYVDCQNLNNILIKNLVENVLFKYIPHFNIVEEANNNERRVADFQNKINNAGEEWISKKRTLVNIAKEHIKSKFIWTIGVEFRQLFAIEEEDVSSKIKHKKSIEKHLVIYRRVLQLFNYIMLAHIISEDYTPKELRIDEGGQLAVEGDRIRLFFNNTVPHSSKEHFLLFQALLKCFHVNRLPFPIRELNNSNFINRESTFSTACNDLCNIEEGLDEGNVLLDCDLIFKAEKNLSIVLVELGFIVKYNLISLRKVELNRQHKAETEFIKEKISLKNMDSVKKQFLLYNDKDEFSNNVYITDDRGFYLSLYPFVIDLNAFQVSNQGSSAEVCFFESRVNQMNLTALDYESISTTGSTMSRRISYTQNLNFNSKLSNQQVAQIKQNSLVKYFTRISNRY